LSIYLFHALFFGTENTISAAYLEVVVEVVEQRLSICAIRITYTNNRTLRRYVIVASTATGVSPPMDLEQQASF
jgi:hypothetical protein